MPTIKKPINKILFYLSSLVGLVLALIAGIFAKSSQYDLSQLKNKAECVFGSGGIAEAAGECWSTPTPAPTPPPYIPPIGDIGCGGCGCAGSAGSSGTAGCCCDGAGAGGGC